MSVIAAAHSNENPGLCFRLQVWRLSRVFQRFPGHFEQKSLLRIHVHCFARRDTKKLRIEAVNGTQKPTPLRVSLSRCFRVGVIMLCEISAVRRNLCNGVAPIAQKFPEAFRIVTTPRDTTSQADNSDGLVPRVLRGCEPGL